MPPDALALPTTRLAFLRTVALLSSVPEASVQRLAAASLPRRLQKGQLLFSQGEPGDAIYVVVSGNIAIVLATADGRELVINEMRAGDFFGELALFPGQTRTASAVARAISLVLCLPCSAFLAELDSQAVLMRRLLDAFAQRLRASSERESALAFMTAPARLARLLLQNVATDGRTGPLVTISQEELAQRVGVTRQTVAKVLGSWRRAGWIITGRGRIMLVDRAALKGLASVG